MNKLKFIETKPNDFNLLENTDQNLVSFLSDEKYGPEDMFCPIELFENWVIVKNTVFLDWNFAEEKYYEKVNVYKFIVFMFLRWYNQDMLYYWCDFFWKTTILKAIEKYNYKFSGEFLEKIKKDLEV